MGNRWISSTMVIKNNQLILADTGDYSGQYWKITSLGNGYCRLTSQWQGDRKSLSVVIDGKGNNQLILADTSDCPKQYWKNNTRVNNYLPFMICSDPTI